MNEINKQNDIFVSTLINGNLSPLELEAHGITSENTGFLSPEEYKLSKFVLQLFSDEKGNFNNELFELAYLAASQTYSNLVNTQTYKNLENYVEYNFDDLYAPLNAKKASPKYEISEELNPTRLSKGVSSLFEWGTSDKSVRELAQLSLIYDWDTQSWLDKTAEDRGIFESLFGQSLVYATWDSDGVHTDIKTGRSIKHKKGDWKLNEKGQYYTETLGDRSSYGKLFVAASDTLTKEDSTLNKIDFFDSDDLNKSAVGTTFKLAAKILPYMFPITREIFGGATAAIAMAGVLPTFGKMLEGIALGGNSDKETEFTKAMNRWEGYFKKYDSSYSDEAQGSNWGYEKIADLVADIFAQLYQMRAAASLSQFVSKDPLKKAFDAFNKKFLPEYLEAAGRKESALALSKKEYDEIFLLAASKLPEVKEATEKMSKLSQRLSLGYMAITSSADVYLDALAGGYDRRTAGLAGIAATLGQYGIMANNKMGDWFLDKTVGYNKDTNIGLMRKALRPYYDDINKAAQALETETTKAGKSKIFGNLISKTNKSIKKLFLDARDGTEPFWTNAIVEGVEEMTEEAVMDSTKAMFDLFTKFGLGTNRNASFHAIENTFSMQGLERYALNALGGFMGGALFEFQRTKVEPWMTAKLTGELLPDTLPSLIRMIANGQTEELLKVADDLGKIDNEVGSTTFTFGNKDIELSANPNQETRGQKTSTVLKDYIKFLEGIIMDEGADLSDEEVLKKTIRDYEVIKLLDGKQVGELLIKDFNTLTSDIASIRAELQSRESAEQNKKEESKENQPKSEQSTKKDNEEDKESKNKEEKIEINPSLNDEEDKTWNKMTSDKLLEILNDKRNLLREFLSGKKGEFYLKQALDFLDPIARNAMGNLSLYRWTSLKYNKDFNDLSKNQLETVTTEWENWKKETDAEKKYLMFGSKAFDKFVHTYSPEIIDYAKNYAEVGKKIIDLLLAEHNFNMMDLLKDEDVGELAYNFLAAVNEQLKINGLGGMHLTDIIKLDPKLVKEKIKAILDNNIKVKTILLQSGYSEDEIINILTTEVLQTLEFANFETLGKDALDERLQEASKGILVKAFKNLEKENGHPFTYEEFNNLMTNLLEVVTFDDTQLKTTESGETIVEEQDMLEAFTKAFLLTAENNNFGLNTSVLKSFLESQELIDSELLQRIETSVIQNIEENINKLIIKDPKGTILLVDLPAELLVPLKFNYVLENEEGEEDEIQFKDINVISPSLLKELKDLIELNFNTVSLEDIIKNFVTKLVNSPNFAYINKVNDALKEAIEPPKFTEDSPFKSFDNIKENLIDKLSTYLTTKLSTESLDFYNRIKKKKTIQNPLFKILKEFDLKLTDGKNTRAIDILEDLDKKLFGAESFSDYLIPNEIKKQLSNIISELEIIKAVVHASTDADIELGRPFARNKQLIRFQHKWQGKKGEPEYNLIPQDIANQINDFEIEKWILKCQLLQEIDDHNFESKLAADQKVEKRVSTQILDYIIKHGTELKIKGVSVLPNDLELNKYESNSLKLDCIETTIREKFAAVTDPKERLQIIRDFIKGLEIDFQAIANERQSASRLNEEFIPNSRDMLNWLATTLGRNTKEYLWSEREMMLTSGKKDVVPLYSQEFVAKLVRSALTDNTKIATLDGESTQNVHDTLIDLFKEAIPIELPFILTKGITFVNGIGGAGKSSIIGGSVIAGIPNKIIQVSAVNLNQVDNYLRSIKKFVKDENVILSGTKHDILKQFFDEADLLALYEDQKEPDDVKIKESKFYKKVVVNKFNTSIWTLKDDVLPFKKDIDSNRLPHIILIDEATHFTSGEIELLSRIHEKFGINFELSGDKAQLGSELKGDLDNFLNLFTWEPPKLDQTIRANVTLKTQNNKRLHDAAAKYAELAKNASADSTKTIEPLKEYLKTEQHRLDIAYYEDDNQIVGDKIVSNLENHIEDIKKLKQLTYKERELTEENDTSWKIGIITELDEKGNASARMQKIITEAGLSSDDYVLYSPQSVHPNAVQGSELKFFIVDKISNQGGIGETIKRLYTFATRALNTSLIELSDADRMILGVRNIREHVTHKDELPLLEKRDKVQEERINYINKFLGDWVYNDKSAPIEFIEEKGKKIPIRKKKTSDKKSDSSKKDSKEKEDKKIDSKSKDTKEEHLSDKALEDIEDALQHNDGSNPYSVFENDSTLSSSDKEAKVNGKKDKKLSTSVPDGMKGWTFLDHSGLTTSTNPEKKYTYIPIRAEEDDFHFDLAGLLNPNLEISAYDQAYKGYERLKSAILAFIPGVSTHEQLVEAIKSDDYIAEFFATIMPQIRHRALELGLTDTKEIMGSWAADIKLDVDPNIYIFGKKYDPYRDAAQHIGDENSDHTPKKDEVLLYFGIKLKCDQSLEPAFINQWISLGRLSQETYGDNKTFASKGFNLIYKEAKERLSTTKFAVFELPNLKVEDLTFDSVFWIKKHSDNSHSENPGIMEMRGAIVDADNLILLDLKKVNVSLPGLDSKPHYKALVILAALDAEAKQKLGQKANFLTDFKTALQRLEEDFIRTDTETGESYCTFGGHYLAMIDFVHHNNPNGGRLRRAVVLSPKSFEIKSVLEDMKWEKRDEEAKSHHNILDRVRKINPVSQARFIVELLANAVSDSSDSKNIIKALQLIQKSIPEKQKNFSDAKLLTAIIDKFKSEEFKTLQDLEHALAHGVSLSDSNFLRRARLMAYYAKLALITYDSKEKEYSVYKINDKIDTSKVLDNNIKKGWDKVVLDLTTFSKAVSNPKITYANDGHINLENFIPAELKEALSKENSDDILDATEFWHIDGDRKYLYNLELKGYFIEKPAVWLPENSLATAHLLDDYTLEQPDLDIINAKWVYQDFSHALLLKPEDFDPRKYPAVKKTEGKNFEFIKDPEKASDRTTEAGGKRRFKGWHTKEVWNKTKNQKTGKKGKHKEKDLTQKPVQAKGFVGSYEYQFRNAMGWEYRIGDRVKLWGRDHVFEIVYIDKNGRFKVSGMIDNLKVVKSKINDTYIEPDAITDVVARLYGGTKAEKEYDYYIKGEISQSLLNLKGYKDTTKTFEIFKNITADEDAKKEVFQFNSATYLFIPITNADEVHSKLTEEMLTDHPERIVRSDASLADMQKQMEEDFENPDSGIIGYRIINLYKTKDGSNDDLFNTLARNTNINIPKVVEKFNEQEEAHILQGTASWVNHVIFKDESVQQNAKNEGVTWEINTLYDENKFRLLVLENPNKPIELTPEDISYRLAHFTEYFPSPKFHLITNSNYFIASRELFYEDSAAHNVLILYDVTDKKGNKTTLHPIKSEYLKVLLQKGKQIAQSLQVGQNIQLVQRLENKTYDFTNADKLITLQIVRIDEGTTSTLGQDIIWVLNMSKENSSPFPIPAWAMYIEALRYKLNNVESTSNNEDVTSEQEIQPQDIKAEFSEDDFNEDVLFVSEGLSNLLNVDNSTSISSDNSKQNIEDIDTKIDKIIRKVLSADPRLKEALKKYIKDNKLDLDYLEELNGDLNYSGSATQEESDKINQDLQNIINDCY